MRTVFNASGYHLAAALISLLCLLPLLWMLAASLRQTGTPLPRTLDIFPWPPVWENYARIFEIVPLGRYLLNSIFVVALAVPLTLLTASWAGFGMSQLPRRLRTRLLVLSILLQMVPVTALWLTRFLLFSWIGLTNSHLALIAPALMGASPLFVLLFYWSFRRVPLEQYEVGAYGRRHTDHVMALDRFAASAPGAARRGAAGVPAVLERFYQPAALPQVHPAVHAAGWSDAAAGAGQNQLAAADGGLGAGHSASGSCVSLVAACLAGRGGP